MQTQTDDSGVIGSEADGDSPVALGSGISAPATPPTLPPPGAGAARAGLSRSEKGGALAPC